MAAAEEEPSKSEQEFTPEDDDGPVHSEGGDRKPRREEGEKDGNGQEGGRNGVDDNTEATHGPGTPGYSLSNKTLPQDQRDSDQIRSEKTGNGKRHDSVERDSWTNID